MLVQIGYGLILHAGLKLGVVLCLLYAEVNLIKLLQVLLLFSTSEKKKKYCSYRQPSAPYPHILFYFVSFAQTIIRNDDKKEKYNMGRVTATACTNYCGPKYLRGDYS